MITLGRSGMDPPGPISQRYRVVILLYQDASIPIDFGNIRHRGQIGEIQSTRKFGTFLSWVVKTRERIEETFQRNLRPRVPAGGGVRMGAGSKAWPVLFARVRVGRWRGMAGSRGRSRGFAHNSERTSVALFRVVAQSGEYNIGFTSFTMDRGSATKEEALSRVTTTDVTFPFTRRH